MSDGQLTLLAPLSGVIYPLERVPDPVFAQKMVGDGLSIDPTDAMPARAVRGRGRAAARRRPRRDAAAAGGVEVLMHIGIDTVALKGEGFTPRVKVGDKVEAGAPLIEFDLDFVATHAKSLLTQIVITNGDARRIVGTRVRHGEGGQGPAAHADTCNGAGAAASARRRRRR